MLAEIARGVGLLDGSGEAAIRKIEFAADVHERVADLQCVRCEQHRLDEEVRRVLEYPAILERAGLALVGVGAQVVRLVVVEMDHGPLAPGRECRAAVTEQS